MNRVGWATRLPPIMQDTNPFSGCLKPIKKPLCLKYLFCVPPCSPWCWSPAIQTKQVAKNQLIRHPQPCQITAASFYWAMKCAKIFCPTASPKISAQKAAKRYFYYHHHTPPPPKLPIWRNKPRSVCWWLIPQLGRYPLLVNT